MVEQVVEMAAEVVKLLVVVHQFKMEMVPLLVGFSLEQILPDKQRLMK